MLGHPTKRDNRGLLVDGWRSEQTPQIHEVSPPGVRAAPLEGGDGLLGDDHLHGGTLADGRWFLTTDRTGDPLTKLRVIDAAGNDPAGPEAITLECAFVP